MSLLDFIKKNRIRLSSQEKSQAGKAKVMKYKDGSKEKYAVHEQPALITTSSLKEAVKKWHMLRHPNL